MYIFDPELRYFSIEFTGNDVTIQPLEKVTSNLFIYSGHRRFGFILKVCQCPFYDDLVKVYWKPKLKKKTIRTGAKKKRKFTRRSFIVGPSDVFISNIFYHRFNDIYVIDGSFVLPKDSKPIKKQIWATRRGKKLKVLDVVFSDAKFREYRVSKFRMFLKLTKPVDFTLRVRLGTQSGRITVFRRWYQ